MAYVTLLFPAGAFGKVKSEKKSKSISASISSSARGFAFSNSGSPSVGVCSGSVSSNITSDRTSCPLRLRFRRAPQKNLSSHASKWSDSYMKGRSRVRTRMQFRASLSGASSGSGKEGWFRRMHNLEVTAKMRVSRFSKLLSLVRRMSAGENSEKTSSADSGSSQNCRTVNRSVLLVDSSLECHTPVQYGSSARMSFCSERRKMPCLKTSFESEAPIRNHFTARLLEVGCRQTIAEEVLRQAAASLGDHPTKFTVRRCSVGR